MVDLFKKIVTPMKKKILIYQNEDYHSETSGIIIQNYIMYDIDVYHPHKKSINDCFDYYSKIFSKKINRITYFDSKSYDHVFMLTDREISKIKHNNQDNNKFILFKHINDDGKHKKYMNICFTKLVEANICMLPIYNHENHCERKNIISIIGNMSSSIVRDLTGIFKLGTNEFIKKNYVINIYTRKIEKKFHDNIINLNQFKVYINQPTETMINEIRKSKFILTADTEYYTKVGPNQGVMTGMIPLALNNEIPLIMSCELNNIYNILGIVEYKKMCDIANIIKTIDNGAYFQLLKKFVDEKNKIINENKKIFETKLGKIK